MPDLPARLEAATEGSRELDTEIALAVYPEIVHRGTRWEMRGTHVRIEQYTIDTDAALTLMDPNLAMTIHKVASLSGVCWAIYVAPRGEMQGKSHASLPLAICAAALRARAG